MATVILEHSDRTGSDRLGEVLRDHGHRIEVLRLHQGDPVPRDLENIDAIVTCGGPQSPLDTSIDWFGPQMDLLRAAHESSTPIVGLCLGCQLLARALGGEVALLDGGGEFGWHEVRLSPPGREDPILAGIAWQSMQMHWHRYHVTKLPAGARVLALSEKTPVQAWGLGLRTYAFQYHPEAFTKTIEGWAADEPESLREAGLTIDSLRTQTDEHYPSFARLSQRLFESIALLLMPVDRRFAGITKDLHY